MPIHKIFISAAAHGNDQELHVRLKLRKEWSLRATFPISLCTKQEVRWHIMASSEGELQELARNRSKVPYLFYETSINASLPLPMYEEHTTAQLGTHPLNALHAGEWCPNKPDLMNGTEISRPRAGFVEYIESILRDVFIFDARQCTDAITALLGTIEYERVIFRFLSKEEVESAAQLTTFPPPDIVVRAFLLYGNSDTTAGSVRGHSTGMTGLPQAGIMPNEQFNADILAAKMAMESRETDWATLVTGLAAPTLQGSLRNPALTKVTEYGSYEIK